MGRKFGLSKNLARYGYWMHASLKIHGLMSGSERFGYKFTRVRHNEITPRLSLGNCLPFKKVRLQLIHVFE
jgi:hypothetical protein